MTRGDFGPHARTHTRTNVQMQTYAPASASSAQDMHNKNTFEGREEPKKRERQVLTLELHVLNRARTPGGVRGQRRRFSSRTASLVAFYCFCVLFSSQHALFMIISKIFKNCKSNINFLLNYYHG